MRQILPFIFVFITSICYGNEPNNSLNSVKSELSQLDKLENYVNNHEGISLEKLKSSENTVVENLNINETASIMATPDTPLKIPSLVWGICCGCIGIAIVYFGTDKDSEETKKALLGYLIGTVVGVVIGFLTGGFSATATTTL